VATTTSPMSVDEFRKLPESGEFYYELRHGEPVRVTRPKYKHSRIQHRLERLLAQAAGSMGVVTIEFPFRALPELELRAADVAFLNQERWDAVDPEDNLHGAPELVIEVLSPSNTAAEINDKERLCLENGAQEFWVVDPNLRQVKVSTPDGITTTFRATQEIPLRIFGSGSIQVDDIFS
jgi:Uma2 family endonuclease